MGKFARGVKVKHCWALSTNFGRQKVCWHHPAMFCLITSSKLSKFEFSLKVKVIGSNPSYLLKSFLLYLSQRHYLCYLLWTCDFKFKSEILMSMYCKLYLENFIRLRQLYYVVAQFCSLPPSSSQKKLKVENTFAKFNVQCTMIRNLQNNDDTILTSNPFFRGCTERWNKFWKNECFKLQVF